MTPLDALWSMLPVMRLSVLEPASSSVCVALALLPLGTSAPPVQVLVALLLSATESTVPVPAATASRYKTAAQVPPVPEMVTEFVRAVVLVVLARDHKREDVAGRAASEIAACVGAVLPDSMYQ
jgi:hypothetical protein